MIMKSKKVKGTRQQFSKEDEIIEMKGRRPRTEQMDIRKIDYLNERQEQFSSSIKGKEVTIALGLAGSGKAQPLYSTVYTPNGPVKMGDLKIGDDVCTPNGEFAKISNIYPQGYKDCYRVHFSDNVSVDCCDEHL